MRAAFSDRHAMTPSRSWLVKASSCARNSALICSNSGLAFGGDCAAAIAVADRVLMPARMACLRFIKESFKVHGAREEAAVAPADPAARGEDTGTGRFSRPP